MGGHYFRQPLLERILVDMDEVLDIRDNLGADAVRGLAVLLPRSTVYTSARACVRHIMAIDQTNVFTECGIYRLDEIMAKGYARPAHWFDAEVEFEIRVRKGISSPLSMSMLHEAHTLLASFQGQQNLSPEEFGRLLLDAPPSNSYLQFTVDWILSGKGDEGGYDPSVPLYSPSDPPRLRSDMRQQEQDQEELLRQKEDDRNFAKGITSTLRLYRR